MTESIDNPEIMRVLCLSCDTALKVMPEKIDKKIKCPQCKNVMVPREFFNKAQSANSNNQKGGHKIFIKALLVLLFCIGIGGLYLWFFSEVKYDETLLITKAKIDNKSELVKKIGEIEVNQIVDSFANPLLIPKGFDVPDFTAEQNRPTREFFDICVEQTDLIINQNAIKKELFTNQSVIKWNNSYAKNNSSKYLSFILKAFVEIEDLTLDEIICFTDMLKVQRVAVSMSDSAIYTKAMVKLIESIKKHKDNKDPMVSVNMLLMASSLPMSSIAEETMLTTKPILMDAFLNKNETRSDGLFLTPDESAQFSLKLIKLSWHFYINKKNMPDWLYKLAEKEACRLAYCLEPDGCLPIWDTSSLRISRTEDIYRAAIIFDRDDLRYIAANGKRMENAYPPIQKDFEFKETGLFILRSRWNNIHSIITFCIGEKPVELEDCVQITYNQLENKISLSVGPITQVVFVTNTKFNNLNELSSAIESKTNSSKNKFLRTVFDYKLVLNQIDLKIIGMSKPYIFDDKDEIKSLPMTYTFDSYHDIKNSFNIKLNRNSKNLITEIIFLHN